MRNKSKERIIGLILEDVSSDFSIELVRSAVNSGHANKNVRIIVLPGKYNNEDADARVKSRKAVQNSVFTLSRRCRFDGFIIHLGGNPEEFEEHVRRAASDRIPRVFIGVENDKLITVNYDNSTGIGEAVDYLVNICGITKICMLGGREDNTDAAARKAIFEKCLAQNGLKLESKGFINTDMTDTCTAEAALLLDRNPDARAVFCVNDAAAKALYSVMRERELIPGKDIMVFGFDNTVMSSELTPSLSSIGPSGASLGQKAVELILGILGGDKPHSALVPTRLFGRESLPFEMYDYTTIEMENIDSAFIYRMFDDCFYRYRNESHGRENIDLKRLFFEFISQMLHAMKRRYMSLEQFDELCGLIDIFFANGAVPYTDAAKLIKCIDRLQGAMNRLQRSAMVNLKINRLFLRMKENALIAFASIVSNERVYRKGSINNMLDFNSAALVFDDCPDLDINSIIDGLPLLGLTSAAFYMFSEPVIFNGGDLDLPDDIFLKCVVRGGTTHRIYSQRQRCLLGNIFMRYELPHDSVGTIAFPVYYNNKIYGLLLCGCDQSICERGELLTLQLGKAVEAAEIEK